MNVEVQRNRKGSHVRRARFHSSMLDSRMLKKNEKFRNLKDFYVIFICEHDKFRKGLPVYHVDRYIRKTGESLRRNWQRQVCNRKQPIRLNMKFLPQSFLRPYQLRAGLWKSCDR